MNTVFNKGVELSPRMVLEPTLPGIALAAAGLMYLGKKTGNWLKEKIGKINTVKLSLVGLAAGALTGAGAMVFESLPLVWTAGAILSFATGMTLSVD